MCLEKFIGKNSVKNDLSQSIGSRWILYITNFRWHYISVYITDIVEEEGLRNPSSSNNRDSFRLLNHVYLINMFNIHDERDQYFDFGPSKIIQASHDSRMAVAKLQFAQIHANRKICGIIRMVCVSWNIFKIIYDSIIYQNTFSLIVSERRSTYQRTVFLLLFRYHKWCPVLLSGLPKFYLSNNFKYVKYNRFDHFCIRTRTI